MRREEREVFLITLSWSHLELVLIDRYYELFIEAFKIMPISITSIDLMCVTIKTYIPLINNSIDRITLIVQLFYLTIIIYRLINQGSI